MKMSPAGLLMVEDFEGYRGTRYQDAEGRWTIGFGHLMLKGELFPNLLSREGASKLLAIDVQKAENCVNFNVKGAVNQNEFDSLVSLAFNIGTTAFVHSTMLRMWNEGASKEVVANQFLRWCKLDNGLTCSGLLDRRKKEQALFLAQPTI